MHELSRRPFAWQAVQILFWFRRESVDDPLSRRVVQIWFYFLGFGGKSGTDHVGLESVNDPPRGRRLLFSRLLPPEVRNLCCTAVRIDDRQPLAAGFIYAGNHKIFVATLKFIKMFVDGIVWVECSGMRVVELSSGCTVRRVLAAL